MKNKRMMSVAILAMFMFACSKEGPQGPAGINGNANVTVKKIATPSGWVQGSHLGVTPVNTVSITDPDINGNVIDKGAVLFFMKISPGAWYQLPLIYQNATDDIFFIHTVQQGKVNLFCWKRTAGVISGATPNSDSCKYMIILDKSVTGRNRDLSHMSYEEVCRVLGVQP